MPEQLRDATLVEAEIGQERVETQRPCRGHGVGMIGCQHSTMPEQLWGVAAVQVEVAREPATCLLDVGAGLIKGKREAIELRYNHFCPHPIIFFGRLQYRILCDARGPAQQEERTFLGPHLLNLN